ncbi:MAG: hypothetical protein JWN03_6570 [Nocardia sp.]|nr:hypothetical protein [Nocardia sp.]
MAVAGGAEAYAVGASGDEESHERGGGLGGYMAPGGAGGGMEVDVPGQTVVVGEPGAPYLAANNVRNVFTGGTPTTHFTLGTPHDGSIIDHLTERKTSNQPPAEGV